MREAREEGARYGGAPNVPIPAVLESIAQCESHGDPRAISAGGTYRGKYQFSFSTWASVGGKGDPAAASETEQDRRAAMLYRTGGPATGRSAAAERAPETGVARGPGAAAPGPRRRTVGRVCSLGGMDAARLRAAFPVFARFAYLNAGTCGPLPARPRNGPSATLLALGTEQGRSPRLLRGRCSTAARACATPTRALLGAASDDVALTTCTSEGIVRVLGALDLQPGDEVLTSDEEHPGLQGPLAAARDQRGHRRPRRAVRRDRRARSGRRRSSSPART